MRVAVLAEFHHDPATAHLVRDRAGGAGAGERVEDEVTSTGLGNIETHRISASGFGVSNAPACR